MRIRSSMLIAAGLAGLAACQEDRAYVTAPIGPPSYDFRAFAALGLIPGGSVATVGADTVAFTLRNLAALASGGYTFWAADTSATGYVKLTGNVLEIFLRDSLDAGVPVPDPVTEEVIQVQDTTVIANVDTYAGPTDPAVFSVVARMASTGATGLNSAVVSLDGSGTGQFLWRRFEVEGAGALFFGNFGGPAGEGTLVTDTIASAADDDFVFTIVSSRLVGGFRGDEVSVELQGLGRPPEGFVYQGYLVDDNDAGTMVDVLRTTYPERADLTDVDTDDARVLIGFDPRRDQTVVPAQIRNCVSGSTVAGTCTLALTASADSSAYRGFASFVVTLSPKATTGFGPNVVWSAVVPEAVRKGVGVYR